ncbi:MAG: adenylate kinase [Acidimicrobiaceae bacterium]|nr:adenylate kinase [Acidimicrobiia bacterium]MCY4493490.1 adenylate kinase [Acidimicrobiaceae bacterium]
MTTLKMVILGRQGSGKGTQSLRICEAYGCVHVSTGDMLRSAVEQGTELGRQASQTMEAGGLVSDETMNGIVAQRLSRRDIAERGVLLDGFPRTAEQANALERILYDLGERLTVAVNLEVPTKTVTERMLGRGRGDDTPEAIQRRLNLYEQQTTPLLQWFDSRSLLCTVDGVGTEDEVFARIRAVVSPAGR